MKHIPFIYLVFVAILCLGCAKSSTGKEQINPTADSVMDTSTEISDTLLAEVPQNESGEVFDLVVGTYAGSTESAIKDLRAKGFTNAFTVPIKDDNGKPLKRVIAERAYDKAEALRIKESLSHQGITAWIWQHEAGSSDVVSSKRIKRMKINVENVEGYDGRVWEGTIGKKKVTMVLNGHDWSGIDGGYFFFNHSPKQYYVLKMIHYGEVVSGFGQSTDLKFSAYTLDGKKIGEFKGTLDVTVPNPTIGVIEDWNFRGTFRDLKTGKKYDVDVLGGEVI